SLRVGDALNGRKQVLPHLVLVRADCELQMHLVRNNVVFGAAVNGAHRADRRISQVVLASDDGLPCENRTGRDHNRIYRCLRCSAVPSTTIDSNVDGIGIGSRESRGIANLPAGRSAVSGTATTCQAW